MAGQTTKSKEGATQHWCLAANLRIGIYNGEMVFDKLLGNGWSELDEFFGRPP